MHDDEREMLRDSLRRLLAETDGAKVPAALADFGWFELLETDPGEAVPALFEAQGAAGIATPMLDAVMAVPIVAAFGAAPASGSGCPVEGLLLPVPGSGAEPSSALGADGTLYLSGCTIGGAPREGLLGAACVPGGVRLFRIPGEGAPPARPVDGIDPWLGIKVHEGTVPARSVVEGTAAVQAWEDAVAAGRRALAHELVGLSRTMLDLAVDHALARRQFGRPIGSFQAVKHRLADAQVALTVAEAAAAEAWVAGDGLAAQLAKLWAGRAARTVGRQAQQVLGGMGFTWEHPFHRAVRRTLILDSLLGSAGELQELLGAQLLAAGGRVPRLATL